MILIMPFIDDSKEYTAGFEMGMLWEKMKNSERFDNYVIHASNLEQIKLQAKVFGYLISSEKLNEEWVSINSEIIN